jgi:hypothetical protein
VSIREQIAPLEELASIDAAIRRIDEQLESQRGGLSAMRTVVKQLDDRLKGDRDMLTSMDKTRNELVTELRQMSQQIDRSREKLQRSRNERESNAAQREVEELRKLLRDREDELERLNGASEQARSSISDGETKHGTLSGELEGSQGGITSTIGELEAERARKMKDREATQKRLPPAIFRRYESVRTRRPMAIARTYDGTCVGCHLSVPPMMFQKMRRQEEFEQCPHCRRILYYMPPAAEAAGAETEPKPGA